MSRRNPFKHLFPRGTARGTILNYITATGGARAWLRYLKALDQGQEATMPRPEWATLDAIMYDHGHAWDRGEKMGLPNGSYTFETTLLAAGNKPGGSLTVYGEFTVVGVDKSGDNGVLGRTHMEFFTLTEKGEFTWGFYLRAIGEESKVKALPKDRPIPFSVFTGKRFGGRIEAQKNPTDGKMYSRIVEYFPLGSVPQAPGPMVDIDL